MKGRFGQLGRKKWLARANYERFHQTYHAKVCRQDHLQCGVIESEEKLPRAPTTLGRCASALASSGPRKVCAIGSFVRIHAAEALYASDEDDAIYALADESSPDPKQPLGKR